MIAGAAVYMVEEGYCVIGVGGGYGSASFSVVGDRVTARVEYGPICGGNAASYGDD